MEQRAFSPNNIAYIYQNVLTLSEVEIRLMREKGNGLTNY